jgi:hypothetical protein
MTCRLSSNANTSKAVAAIAIENIKDRFPRARGSRQKRARTAARIIGSFSNPTDVFALRMVRVDTVILTAN